MKENEINVLEQYEIDIKSTRKTRGAILCEAKQGIYLLKELEGSKKRLPILYQLCTYLEEEGYTFTDKLVKNKEEEYVSISKEGIPYILKQWFYGKECDVQKESDMIAAVENLARLHVLLRGEKIGEDIQDSMFPQGEDLRRIYNRHNREMKKVRMFIRAKVGKGAFELKYLKHFDEVYEWAQCASDMLEKSDYEELLKKSLENQLLVHGDYNYHNVLMLVNGIATTNFEHFRKDVQLVDFYYLLRKTMEKHEWNWKLGDEMLNTYSKIIPLEEKDLEFLSICIAYPEKFWKAANAYYSSRKAWIPVKTLEKLELAIEQTEAKKQFLNTIFSFHL